MNDRSSKQNISSVRQFSNTYSIDEFSPVFVRFDDHFNGDIRAVLFHKFPKYLTLNGINRWSLVRNKSFRKENLPQEGKAV